MQNKINYLFILLIIFSLTNSFAQIRNEYKISFKNAVHHQAVVTVKFTNLREPDLKLRMSRTSPGRYALHEFVKNVYNLKATDSKGNELEIIRPNPYQWNIKNHNGTVQITYILFGNRGDGTYSQIDETHAHLNIPATFIFAPAYKNRPISVKFDVRKDLNWKVATQLKSVGDNLYYAPNLDYFMDSPVEISNFSKRSFKVDSGKNIYNIHFVLHHNGTEAELTTYTEKVKKIVQQEIAVFGELPDFDYGAYTFLACYIPNASGDGMEHRNSTVLTSTRSLVNKGMKQNLGTVAHEFFHAWNVERIRPKALEPFNYDEANMSGELWFAEGITSYYTGLILCRSGLNTPAEYIKRLAGGLNYVWHSPARKYFNPIEMSYQAPFVDAARSVDPVNRENTFISYYTYGSVLGLALDLSLRNLEGDKKLDDFMKLVWQSYGKSEKPYTIDNLKSLLADYAGNKFSHTFFSRYIYGSQMPDFKSLLNSVGVDLVQQNKEKVYLGATLIFKNKKWVISSNPLEGYAAYKANLSAGDEIISIQDKLLLKDTNLNVFLSQFKPNQTVKVIFKRYGIERQTNLKFSSNPNYSTSIIEDVGDSIKIRRNQWLNPK